MHDHILACTIIGLILISFMLMLYGGWLFGNDLATSSEVLTSVAIPLVTAFVIALIDFWRNLPCQTK